MALSTRKTNMIIADHKAERFDTQTALLKHYKIDRKTLVKILEGITTTNAHVVEAGVKYKNALNSLNNPVEKKAVENVVKIRTIADEIEDVVFEATLSNVKAVKNELKEENKEPTLYDRKTGQECLDKALITAGKASRHANSQVTVNTQTNVQNNTLELTEEEAQEKALALGVPLSALM